MAVYAAIVIKHALCVVQMHMTTSSVVLMGYYRLDCSATTLAHWYNRFITRKNYIA